ncbi:hypothetical protein MJ561_18330 [Klebsiella pneumoniae]|nr:hypothetical protein MJ561_18330 [Klebsiella pneumoniae]
MLDYDTVMASFRPLMDWPMVQRPSALNIIHCMHDKYEVAPMALHDRDVYRTMVRGIAGLSRVDSLSAIKYPG